MNVQIPNIRNEFGDFMSNFFILENNLISNYKNWIEKEIAILELNIKNNKVIQKTFFLKNYFPIDIMQINIYIKNIKNNLKELNNYYFLKKHESKFNVELEKIIKYFLNMLIEEINFLTNKVVRIYESHNYEEFKFAPKEFIYLLNGFDELIDFSNFQKNNEIITLIKILRKIVIHLKIGKLDEKNQLSQVDIIRLIKKYFPFLEAENEPGNYWKMDIKYRNKNIDFEGLKSVEIYSPLVINPLKSIPSFYTFLPLSIYTIAIRLLPIFLKIENKMSSQEIKNIVIQPNAMISFLNNVNGLFFEEIFYKLKNF